MKQFFFKINKWMLTLLTASVFCGSTFAATDLKFSLDWKFEGPSTKTYIKEATSFSREDYGGRNLHFGVREHAMGAIINGMSLS